MHSPIPCLIPRTFLFEQGPPPGIITPSDEQFSSNFLKWEILLWTKPSGVLLLLDLAYPGESLALGAFNAVSVLVSLRTPPWCSSSPPSASPCAWPAWPPPTCWCWTAPAWHCVCPYKPKTFQTLTEDHKEQRRNACTFFASQDREWFRTSSFLMRNGLCDCQNQTSRWRNIGSSVARTLMWRPAPETRGRRKSCVGQSWWTALHHPLVWGKSECEWGHIPWYVGASWVASREVGCYKEEVCWTKRLWCAISELSVHS